MLIESVEFKRTRESEYEPGIMFNNDQLIVDSNAKAVRGKLWSYRRTHRLLLEIPFIEPMSKEKTNGQTKQ